jgi:GR25 family glycosyltransferase involved in LPS biosynthesis
MKIIIFYIFFIFVILITFFKINRIENFESNNIFDKVYVINLDHSKDRLKFISNQLIKEGISFERYPAINGGLLDKYKLIKEGKLINERITKGAIGCYLSHYNIWKKELNNGRNILVLEDDVILRKNLLKNFKEIYKQIPENWDIIYLGASNIYGKKIDKNIVEPIKTKNGSTFNTGMYGMLINKKALPILIKDSIPIDNNIDQYIKKYLFQKLNVYFIVNPLITHNNKLPSQRRILSGQKPTTSWFSDIQSNINIV